MIIVKVEKNNIERALSNYKSRIIKTKQMSELVKRKEFIKKSIKKRNVILKAEYVQKKKNEEL